jgi:CubicO group peptidase (beta-lactamase class C family)
MHLTAQTSYFPPVSGNTWDTENPANLNWSADSLSSLNQFLNDQNTKAFIILVDGKIAVEWYFDSFTQDSIWYWASAGKSLTSFLVGMALEDSALQLSDPTSMYLGQGWTNLSPTDENNIQIIHQLSMTSGLDDGVSNPDCTDPNCLNYLASPGSRWAYHNAPYTLLLDVLESAWGTTVNSYILNNLTSSTGITGLFVPIGDNRVYVSTPRSMARFGLLALENGIWDGDTVLGDMNYIQQMAQPSQNINESYGYLWWLNGQNSHMLPGVQFPFPGFLVPNAPADMFMALGLNDQKIYVVPSSNMVVIRMGNPPDIALPGPSSFDNQLWARLSFLHQQLHTPETEINPIKLYPSPAVDEIHVSGIPSGEYVILDHIGRVCSRGKIQNGERIDVSQLPAGAYLFHMESSGVHCKFSIR